MAQTGEGGRPGEMPGAKEGDCGQAGDYERLFLWMVKRIGGQGKREGRGAVKVQAPYPTLCERAVCQKQAESSGATFPFLIQGNLQRSCVSLTPHSPAKMPLSWAQIPGACRRYLKNNGNHKINLKAASPAALQVTTGNF